jgi:alpha-L-glutamate ligase-like protein
MLATLKKSRDILGMNSRNLKYIRPNNLRRAKRIADDKLMSKRILKQGNLPVPKLIAKITSLDQLDEFNWESLPNSFVLKPNKGFGGGGIIVVYGKKKNKDAWIKADGSIVTIEDLKTHIHNILDGSFSLSNSPDVAFFEERMKLHKTFKPYTFKGVPDVRVIVYNRVPVMAMLRLPTRESGGKANLQLGAIGVGIDLASGTTTTAVHGKHSKSIEYIPKTRMLLSGIKIPYWKDILRMAIEAQEVSGLGFLGADVAIDRELGPVFLELNARPGLSIQIANLSGLKDKLNRVQGLKIKSIDHGIRVGMDLFGGEIEEELESMSGKKIIGTIETIKLIGNNDKEIKIKAKIDTGAWSSSIDIELAKKLGFEETIQKFSEVNLDQFNLKPENEKKIKKDFLEQYQESIPLLEDVAVVFSASGSSIRPVIKLPFKMSGTQVVSKVNITDRSSLQYSMLVGRRDLKKFLIQVK